MAINNLTNTTWVIDGYGSVHYDGSMYINFTSNNTNYTKITFYTDDVSITYNTTRVCEANDMNNYTPSDWVNEAYRTISITGGQDVTNATLIAWLEENASQISSTVDIVLGSNTLNGVDTIKVTDASDITAKVDFIYGVTPSGTKSIKIGDTTLNGVNQINVRGTDSTYKSFGYQQASLPTFTARQSVVSYGPYQFEQGMTFAQWVASAYNTDGWTATEYAIVLNGFYFMKGNNVVRPTDLVEAIQYYLETDN